MSVAKSFHSLGIMELKEKEGRDSLELNSGLEIAGIFYLVFLAAIQT